MSEIKQSYCMQETRCWEFAGYHCGCAGISSMAGTPVTSKFARYTDIVEQQQVAAASTSACLSKYMNISTSRGASPLMAHV